MKGKHDKERQKEFGKHRKALGVASYEYINGRKRNIANWVIRQARGTASTPDAVEIYTVKEDALRSVLSDPEGRRLWQETASCESGHFSVQRSFILIGVARRLLEGSAGGQRVLWFGNGLPELSREAFIEHYTRNHGPLVAGHARLLGLKSYYQVPAEHREFQNDLQQLGLGQALPPAVFAQLIAGAPPLNPAVQKARREASRQIKEDEKQHISFSDSMLLLAN